MKKALIVILVVLVLGAAAYAYSSAKQSGSGDQGNGKGLFCTLDAKLCPDGSYVGRVPPNCDFALCPGTNATSTGTTTETANSKTKAAASMDLTASSTVSLPRAITVTYTSSGFSPKDAIVAKGGTVTFVNRSGTNMWVASDPHPTHNGYPGFDELRSVPSGGSWSFRFDREGSWGYHNHIVPTQGATIIVQ